MLTAKENFILRITNFENIVSPENPIDSVLISKELTEKAHNEKVKMLRNGLAIIGYTILEDFIKKRIGEVLKEIGKCSVGFNELPSRLRDASTVSALKGVIIRAESLKRNSEDYLGFIQNETRFISSTKESVYELSEYSLGWEKSNLSSDDISNFLGIFNVKDGWNAIQGISSAINITLANPSDIFKNAAIRRHKAAHNIEADSLLSDLESFISQSKVIAFGFDSLISKSLQHIKDRNSDFLNEKIKTEASQISYRFLINEKSVWKEYRNNFSKAFRIKSNFDELLNEAKLRAKKGIDTLLIKSEKNQIINWYIF